MKTNHFIALAAGIVGVMLIVIAALFSRQSGLEDEIARLRTMLGSQQGAPAIPSQATVDALPSRADWNRIGMAEPATSADPLTDARTRLLDLERIVNGQADFIEDLLAENARKAEAERRASMRSWGTEQATGAPDTMTAGDHTTAWAPANADGGVEWLEAEFENAADLAKIVVRQTSNPGCITKVTAITEGGGEVPVWSGVDPSKGQALADTPFAVPPGINAKRVKVYLDTSKVAGWEEIDALQIVGLDGRAQWAKSVNASSTYGSSTGTYQGRRNANNATNKLLLLNAVRELNR